MSKPYIPPPDVSEVVHQLAKWIALLFRVGVTISIDDGNGNKFTVTAGKP